MLKINQIYHNEVQHLISVLKLSNQIIMDDYYLLRSMDLIDINMHENLEQLKRLGRGRRDAKITSSTAPAVGVHAASTSVGLVAACASDEGVGDAMDRFNITMADHCAESTADDDDGDFLDYDALDADDEPIPLNATVSIVPAATRRRSRSMTSGSAEPPAKKPIKKLFKADSFNVRNAILSKSGSLTAAGRPGSAQMPLPPRASVHANSAAALRERFVLAGANGGGGGDAMDVDVDDSSFSKMNTKGIQSQGKTTVLRGILKDSSVTSLYQKG